MSCRLSVIDERDNDYCISPFGSGSAGPIWRCRHSEAYLHDWQRYNAVTPEVVPLLPAWQNLQFTSCVHQLPCLCSCYKIPLSTRRQKLQLVTIHRRNLSIIHETLIEADTYNTTQQHNPHQDALATKPSCALCWDEWWSSSLVVSTSTAATAATQLLLGSVMSGRVSEQASE